MGMLTEDMKLFVEEQQLGFHATVCPDGTPNLSPKGSTRVWDDDHPRTRLADARRWCAATASDRFQIDRTGSSNCHDRSTAGRSSRFARVRRRKGN